MNINLLVAELKKLSSKNLSSLMEKLIVDGMISATYSAGAGKGIRLFCSERGLTVKPNATSALNEEAGYNYGPYVTICLEE